MFFNVAHNNVEKGLGVRLVTCTGEAIHGC